MPNDAMSVREWRVAYPTSGGFIKFFKKNKGKQKFVKEFEQDVTTNLRRHSNPDKIVEIKREDLYPPHTYRWSKKNILRIVYTVSNDDMTIHPLDADSPGPIRYKRR
jgi:hypothetical protein